ncbi:MAG: TetR family transcriptional regulator [Burkholderiales bacterium]|nr:TetR family transcriptional regulator [Burkholderiales bacterium]
MIFEANLAAAPLPPELAAALAEPQVPAPKRERTRRQLVDAALRVFSTRGVAASTIGDIAAAAGVAGATVYNHFASKDELVQAVALWLAQGLCRRIADSCAGVSEGAERMAIGNRRYLWLAEQSPAWAQLMMDVAALSPALLRVTGDYVLADLRLGVRQKAFRITTEPAALDLVGGTISQAMRIIAAGLAPPGHAAAVTTMVLAGLGLPWDQARTIVRRPLPPLVAAQAPAASAVRRRRAVAPRATVGFA